ncbi:Uncharacterized protein ToN1_30720 [Aromatoleum petrolei]|nr:Uncharacterized protein ToN1_30720 [Aromatoleum petrolei]
MSASFLALALMFFAVTTMVAYYCIVETNLACIKRKVHRP